MSKVPLLSAPQPALLVPQKYLVLIAGSCVVCALCSLLIVVSLYSSSSLVATTVEKANNILDEALATGILPLVKDIQERVRTEGNATATVVIEAAQQTSTLLLQYTRAIGTVNATAQVLRVQKEVEDFLSFLDAFVRQRSLSITL